MLPGGSRINSSNACASQQGRGLGWLAALPRPSWLQACTNSNPQAACPSHPHSSQTPHSLACPRPARLPARSAPAWLATLLRSVPTLPGRPWRWHMPGWRQPAPHQEGCQSSTGGPSGSDSSSSMRRTRGPRRKQRPACRAPQARPVGGSQGLAMAAQLAALPPRAPSAHAAAARGAMARGGRGPRGYLVSSRRGPTWWSGCSR